MPPRRSSRRITKGKARAPSDVDMDVDRPERGRKRTAEHAVSDDGEDDDDNDNDNEDGDEDEDEDEDEDDISGDPTLRKARIRAGRGEISIVVDSPPHTRPKQRIRVNEAGDTVGPLPPSDEAVVASKGVWVGRGDVRRVTYLFMSATLTSYSGSMRRMPQR